MVGNAQHLVTAEINRAFPDEIDATITGYEWVPAHADLNWANLTCPECWILDWEDHGLAPPGLDAATLWISSLAVPTLAERVCWERRSDLETRSGKLMTLFHCAKIINDASSSTDPVFELTAREAAKLFAEAKIGHTAARESHAEPARPRPPQRLFDRLYQVVIHESPRLRIRGCSDRRRPNSRDRRLRCLGRHRRAPRPCAHG